MNNKGTTSNFELLHFAKNHIPDFGGVFSKDTLPKKLTHKYYIVNVDTSKQPGSHWVALVDNIFYDSFGRESSLIGRGMVSTNDNIEQDIYEENCGQRSLAYILTHMKYPSVIEYI